MPSVTRSQSKMNTNSSVTSNIIAEESNKAFGNYKYNSDSEYPKDLKDKINNFKKYCMTIIKICNENNKPAEKKYDSFYFDNIRIVTELYHYVYESIDSVFIIDGLVCCPDLQKVINMMYAKSFSFLREINTKRITTFEQQHICNCFFQQIKETQQKLYLYVTEKPPRFPRVCYTEYEDEDEDEEDFDEELQDTNWYEGYTLDRLEDDMIEKTLNDYWNKKLADNNIPLNNHIRFDEDGNYMY
jgi:hypothetical protein